MIETDTRGVSKEVKMGEVWAGQLGELRAASTADGGTALTTTATYIQLPLKTGHVFITPRNLAGAVVAKVHLNPWLVVLKTTDNLAGPPVDYSEDAQDASTSTTVDVSSLSTLANGDFLLVGSHLPFRGVYIDVYGTNSAGTAALDVAYWNGVAWADITDTDGTFSTRVFAQDGLVYWTVPSAWKTSTLKNIYNPTWESDEGFERRSLYWTRWSVDAAITDTAVTFYSMVAANRDTSHYAELLSGQRFEERIKHGEIGGIGCVEALTNAGTANLIVNIATTHDGRYE